MLHHELGEESFWRSLALYAERHAQRSVETRDLARAIEEASGRNIDRFFDQWVQSPGHVELEAGWEWDSDASVGTLRLAQKQGGDKVYAFSTTLRFEVDGVERDETVNVRERSHAFEFRLPKKPTMVIFDPGDVVLKTIKFEKSRPLWTRQLKAARPGVDRVLAARTLGEKPEPATVEALAEALAGDPFWAVRSAAATSLGRSRRSDALAALLAARHQPHARVRRAVAAALGEFRGDEQAAEALARWAEEGDPSYFVEANAALALGRTRSPRATEVLPRLLRRSSFQDVVRSRAIEGLGASGDEAALPVARDQYSAKLPFQSRRAALAAVTRLSEGTLHARAARELAEKGLDDRDFRVRIEAAQSLATLADLRAVPALERALAAELDGRARRRIREATTDLRERGKPQERVRKLEEELERLRNEGLKLRERLEKVESRTGVTRTEAAAPPETPKRPRPRVRRAPKPPRGPRRR
jgi:aminopeptidase N